MGKPSTPATSNRRARPNPPALAGKRANPSQRASSKERGQPAARARPSKAIPRKPAAAPRKPAAAPRKPAAAPRKPAAAPRKPATKPAARARPSTAAPRKPAAKPGAPSTATPRKPAAAPTDQAAPRKRREPPRPAPDVDAGADRATHIASVAAERAKASASDGGPVSLGSITVPSGTLAIFDVGLMGYLPREVLDPMLICTQVPSDRPLAVVGTRVGKGRFADCWDHVSVELADRPDARDAPEPRDLRPDAADAGMPPSAGPGHREITHTRKLGEAAADFARLICMDRAAIDHWQHEDSLDQLADFVFWGRDDGALARVLGARRLAGGDGYGWTDLPMAEAEAKADRAAQLKSENKWLIATELRPHSHHFAALAAARASPSGAGVLAVVGARVLLFFTSWGNGVFPVYLELDEENRPVRIRIQLAPAESGAAPGASARPVLFQQ